jgi:UDP-glucose 4-epimerase
LLARPETSGLTIYDNFSSGREWHLAPHQADPRFRLVRGELADQDLLRKSLAGHDCVIHLASNPDIAKAATDPDIDYRQGTELTRHVLEAMRVCGAKKILYTSGSGVYGDQGETPTPEDFGPLNPVSTYGASKLAGEALISAYCHMFGLEGRIFRFANVIGGRQTHGVGLDFLKRLLADPTRLRILGDGTQSKSYIHVLDIMAAVLMVHERAAGPLTTHNVGTGDYITVNQIAELACEAAGLDPAKVVFERTGGRGGWKGDVPVMRLDTTRIQALGWRCQRGSVQAMRESLTEMLPLVREGRL